MTEEHGLKDKVAIVTGASSGMGAHFARVLAKAGARVVLVARRTERLQQLATELPHALICATDLTQPEAVPRIIDSALDAFGGIHVVVNNAGMSSVMPATEEPLDAFERVLRVNLVSPFVLAREAARHMIASGTGGTIVNVSSILGLVGVGRIPQAGYTASKGGLVNLTRELAAQWARHGVRVNAIAPGWFETEMTQEMFDDPKGGAWVQRMAPMGRTGRLDELTGPLLFLAGSTSSYVTGQVLAVDGGWTAV